MQENLAAGREDLASFVDSVAVHQHRDHVAHAQAFDGRPLAEWALDVAAASKTGYVLPRRIFVQPGDRSGIERPLGGAGRVLVLRVVGLDRTVYHRHRDSQRHMAAVGIPAVDQQKIAKSSFHDLALDRCHVRAAADIGTGVAVFCPPAAVVTAAVRAHAVQEDPRVGSHALSGAKTLRAPLQFNHQAVVLVRAIGAQVPESVPRDAQHAIAHRVDPARVLMLGVDQPSGPTAQIPAVEQTDRFLRRDRCFRFGRSRCGWRRCYEHQSTDELGCV